MSATLKTESAVKERYAAGAQAQEAALCCPVDYDPKYLKVIPDEVIERDYGCGDPSKYVKKGETVLDLGSGTGKICFIASQVVGKKGKVIGVDMTDDMLEVARRNVPVVGEKIGYENVEFHKGRIQDLALDLEQFEKQLKKNPVKSANAFLEAQELADELRIKKPMIPDNSIDVVVSNCVLNLVSQKGSSANVRGNLPRPQEGRPRRDLRQSSRTKTFPLNCRMIPISGAVAFLAPSRKKSFSRPLKKPGFTVWKSSSSTKNPGKPSKASNSAA